jgi:hypothetical protein
MAKGGCHVFSQDFEVRLDVERVEVLLNEVGRLFRGLDKVDVGGAAAQGFHANGTGSGIEIHEHLVCESGGISCRENVEKGFAEAVGGGAYVVSGEGFDGTTAELAGDDAQGKTLSCRFAILARHFVDPLFDYRADYQGIVW